MSRGRPRVLLVNDTLAVGGTEGQYVEVACRLSRARWDVRAACLRAEGPLLERLQDAGLQPWSCGGGSFKTPRGAAAVVGLARRLRCDHVHLVHTFDFYSNVLGVLAARAARVQGVVASQRNLGTLPPPARRAVQRMVLRLAHCVVVNSEAVAARLRDAGVVKPERLVVVLNGVDASRFGPRARPHAPGTPVAVGTIGNLRPEKGLLHLVSAATQVRERYDVRVPIWGDGPVRAELGAAIRDVGADDVVTLRGHIARPETALAELDIFVQASLSEATSNALLEAMATGLPIVATEVGGTPALIEHEITGLLVPPGDSAALAKAIIRLVEAPRLAAELGTRARARVRSRFGMERMVGHVEQIYTDVLRAGARGARRHTP